MNRINLLLTGGFDSSLSLLAFSSMPVTVQPIYIDDARQSTLLELQAIVRICNEVLKSPSLKCELLPLRIYGSKSIAPDAEISEAWQRMRTKYQLGSQYDWLARFAKEHCLKLDLSLEYDPIASKALKTIWTEGKVAKYSDGVRDYFAIVPEESSRDLNLLFANMIFPVPVWEMTKRQELDEYKRLGFEHCIEMTWFCFRPIGDKPCGKCNPCKTVISVGLGFRIPQDRLPQEEQPSELPKAHTFERRLKTKILARGTKTMDYAHRLGMQLLEHLCR